MVVVVVLVVVLKNSSRDSIIRLAKIFAINISVQLVIEWFSNNVSLAIETRYQNVAVMAVWRRIWKRLILIALVNAFPLAVWNSSCLLMLFSARFKVDPNQPCKDAVFLTENFFVQILL